MIPDNVKRLALVLVVIVALAEAAAADRIAVVATSSVEPPVSAKRLSRELSRVLVARGDEAIDPFAASQENLGQRAVLVSRLSSFARARRLMLEGWRSYLQVRASFAASRLATARQEATNVLDLEGGLELFAEISLRLGTVKHELGRKVEAADDFRLAYALNPERPVTDDEFKRAIVDSYRRAHKEERPRSRRTIDGLPKRASIEVDGKPVGVAPVRLVLDAGLHVIVVRSPGRVPFGDVVSVRAGQDRILSFDLRRDPLTSAVVGGRGELKPGTSEGRAQVVVEALSAYGELDGLLLAASVWRRGAPALLGQYCLGSPMRCGRVVEIGYAKPDGVAVAAKALLSRAQKQSATASFSPMLPTDVRLADAESPPGKGGEPGGRRWWKNPWVWLGAAGVAIAATGAIVLTRDRGIAPVVEVDPCKFGMCE